MHIEKCTMFIVISVSIASLYNIDNQWGCDRCENIISVQCLLLFSVSIALFLNIYIYNTDNHWGCDTCENITSVVICKWGVVAH